MQTGITYAEFIVADDKVIFICDGGSRKSTHNHKQSKADIKEDEKVLKTISEKNLLFSAQLRGIRFTLRNGRILWTLFRRKKEQNDKYFDAGCCPSSLYKEI